MRRKQQSSSGAGAVSNHDLYDTDPPRPGRLLGMPAPAPAPQGGAAAFNAAGRGMSFPGATAASGGGQGGGGGSGGGGAVGGGGGVDLDLRLRDSSQKGGKRGGGFRDWKRRVGEKAIQKIGLAAPSNDANTGDIEQPLHSFVQMRDGLKDIQAQVRNYVLAMEGLFGAAHNMTFLFAPLSGETAKQLKLSLCRVAVQDAMIRGLTEYLEAPLKAVLDFCDGIDLLAKRRGQLLLDYDHHKRKHEAVEARRESGKGGDMEDEVKARSTKLNASIDNLKDCTTQILAQVAALSKVEPQLKESLFKGLSACQVFYCQASLSAFETDFVESTDMRDYVMNLQSTTTTLENSMPLPPLGEHVAFLRNALASAAAEVRGEGKLGYVYGRPLSDLEEPPPLLLECIGFLDAHGLYVPGLFRVPGNTEKIQQLKSTFDAGEHMEFDERIHDVHEVATLLKMYFRELPEPVVPTAFYHPMLEASVKDLTEFVETVRVLVAQLPEINRTCVRLLFAFLLRVSLLSAENLMTTENLGIVFAPNLLRAPNATEMNVMDLQACINLVKRIIECAKEIFPGLWQGYPVAASQG